MTNGLIIIRSIQLMKAASMVILVILASILMQGSYSAVIFPQPQTVQKATRIDSSHECLANLTNFAVIELAKTRNITCIDFVFGDAKALRKKNETTYYLKYENANISALFTGVCNISNSPNATKAKFTARMTAKNGTNSTREMTNLTTKGLANLTNQQTCTVKIVQLVSGGTFKSMAMGNNSAKTANIKNRFRGMKFADTYILSGGNKLGAGICNLSNGQAILLPQQLL